MVHIKLDRSGACFPKSIISELWLLNYVELQRHDLQP